jgi:hypothetical protein
MKHSVFLQAWRGFSAFLSEKTQQAGLLSGLLRGK